MEFTAKLRPASAIKRRWTQAGQIGGVVRGVRFSKAANGDFVTGLLAEQDVEALRGAHTDVLLEATAVLQPASFTVLLPEPTVVVVAEIEPVEPPMDPELEAELKAQMEKSAALRSSQSPAKARPIPPNQWQKGKR